MLVPRWRRRLYILLFLIAAYLLGSTAQEQLGISFSIEGLQDFRVWVEGLGWWGPVVFVLLVIFRLFIGLTSHLVFILGGLAFGITGGIVWGGLGLTLSALTIYFLAQHLGADWVKGRFGEHYQVMLDRVRSAGAFAVFAITAHPVGVLTPTQLAAGLVRMPVGTFTLAVALASPLRAAPYVLLGTAVLDLTVTQSLAITGGLLLVFVVPLLFPGVRRWLWGKDSRDDKELGS